MKPAVAEQAAEVEMKHFTSSMLRLAAQSGKSLEEAVRVGAVMFARSAARATPPDAGKQISAKRFKRTIKAEPYVMAGTTKIHLKYVPGYENKYLSGLRPKGRGVKADYAVLTKIPRRSRKFRAVIYDSLEKARTKEKISTRGLLRAGWWGALVKFGEQAAEKFGSAVPALLSRIAKVNQIKSTDGVEIQLSNCVEGYDEAKRMVLPYAYGRAGNAMNSMAKKIVDKMIKEA